MNIGVVITLKEMNGINRIDDFIKLCMVRGWIVNRIDVNTRVDIYAKSEENIDFDWLLKSLMLENNESTIKFSLEESGDNRSVKHI